MTNISGYFFIDGIDLWTTFRAFIEEGSADLLRYPPKKQSIVRDWRDANGQEVDLSNVFFDSRDVTLNMAIIVENEAQFWEKHAAFISHLIQPGLRRLSLKSHGERSYYVYYLECNNYKSVAPLKGEEGQQLKAYRFSLALNEPEPVVDASHTFLVDEEGHYIIT